MNPKPFASLNHFTVPVAILFFRCCRRSVRPPSRIFREEAVVYPATRGSTRAICQPPVDSGAAERRRPPPALGIAALAAAPDPVHVDLLAVALFDVAGVTAGFDHFPGALAAGVGALLVDSALRPVHEDIIPHFPEFACISLEGAQARPRRSGAAVGAVVAARHRVRRRGGALLDLLTEAFRRLRGLRLILVERAQPLLEALDRLTQAVAELRQLRRSEEQQRQRENDDDLSDPKPHDVLQRRFRADGGPYSRF